MIDWEIVEIVRMSDEMIKTSDSDIINVDACDRMIVFTSDRGDPGQSCTVRIGRTRTLDPGSSATVENAGSEYDVLLNFGIPRGADAVCEWGSITGTLSNQTDLQNALDNKVSLEYSNGYFLIG